jgi:hypothetical protein
MFERLRRLFRSVRTETSARARTAAPEDPFGVPFQADLPERMREAHAAMRAAFELAQDSERRGEHDRVLVHLEAFDDLLRGYVAGPSNDFHVYMAERLAPEAGRMMALRSIRAKLRLLSHEVHDLTQPRRADPERPVKPTLSRTLVEWGTTLRDNLAELERDLMPLYRKE